MANKLIMTKALKHYYDEPTQSQDFTIVEPDKTKSISELTTKELREMIGRVRSEQELQSIIKELKRNSGEKSTYENPIKVDTKTPINQLYHYGIKGMQWGVRRYQNPDGTRTPAGKRRDARNEASGPKTAKSKNVKDLSNEELKALTERIKLEEAYKRLTTPEIQKGESWVKKSIASAGEQALTEFSKGVMLGSAKLLVKELSPSFAESAFNVKEKKKG